MAEQLIHGNGDEVIERPRLTVVGSPDNILAAAHQRQADFHLREKTEGPARGMPEVQVKIHQNLYETHLAALAVPQFAEVVEIHPNPEELIA